MDDIDRICANLEHMSGAVADCIEAQMRKETLRIQADAKRLAPVESGYLRERITADVERDTNGDIIGTVGTNVSYAIIKEFGSGPVGAASDKVLPDGITPEYRQDGWVYKDPKTGKFVYTRGQPATPFLYPAFLLNKNKAAENILNAARKGAKGG